MLTIVTAMPWEAARFEGRLRGRRRTSIGEGWSVWGTAGRADVRVIVSGPGEARAREAASELASLEPAVTGVLCSGVAAGLIDGLRAGDVVLGERAQHLRVAGGRAGPPLTAYAPLLRFVAEALDRTKVRWRQGDILTVDEALLTPASKRRQHEQTRALAAAMEDYAWAEAAAALEIPFVAARAILDPVGASVPEAVLGWDWRGPSGGEVARSLLRHPTLPLAMGRLAWQRRAAVRSIDRMLAAVVSGDAAGGIEAGETQR